MAGTRAGSAAANRTLLTPQTPPLQPVQLSNGQDSQNSSPVLGRQDRSSFGQTEPAGSFSNTTPPTTPLSRRGGVLQTPQDASASNSSISPLVKSQASAAMNRSTELGASQEQIPLAIAVIETCNALFKGVEQESCVVKISGEVAMSFPSSFLSKISPSSPLKFKVDKKGVEVERFLHNQHLLKK